MAADGPTLTALPAGEDFYGSLADHLLAVCARSAVPGDLTALRIVVPALPMAAELRAALAQCSIRPLLLPPMETLSRWVDAQPPESGLQVLTDSARLVLLHQTLRRQGGFDEGALWGVAAEMATLFDELTVASVCLPQDETAWLAQLERAYAMRASQPLAYEARVVHGLWRALAALGQPDAASAYRIRLSALAQQMKNRPDAPDLLVLLDAAPAESLDPATRDFFWDYAQHHAVHLVYPAPRERALTPVMDVLAAAWPQAATDALPLIERAGMLRQRHCVSPLTGRVQFMPADGLEQEAQAAVTLVAQWLSLGLRRIALISQDRLTARRVRALLEREGVLVSDETGWKLSTSRAAATVDALLETVAGNAYYRDLLDLGKSPFVFADDSAGERQAGIDAIEQVIRNASIKSGIARVELCLRAAAIDAGIKNAALAQLSRIAQACRLLRAKPVTLPQWIDRLCRALECLGARASLARDAAGKSLLELLDTQRQELSESTASFDFAAWRDWLDRLLESASFREEAIRSPVLMTPLNAVCLRRFDAALLLGGDARQLTPARLGTFFPHTVRRELGLRTHEDNLRALERDLELLLATVPRVVVSWQSTRDGEANLLAPSLALLSTLHALAWQDDLHRPPLPARLQAVPDRETAPVRAAPAAPVAPAERLPQRVSVSALSTLIACPYRFFARHVLALGEMDEVVEDLQKREYGELVHRVLECFHTRHPVISDLPPDEALTALKACTDEVFAAAIAVNFLATGWRIRWENRLAAYLDWQRAHEAQGWRFAHAEVPVRHHWLLDDGAQIELYGRIDRIDRRAACATSSGGAATLADAGLSTLLDYKTQARARIRERLADDVQLPAYALMQANVEQAAYLALDDDRIEAIASAETAEVLADAAEAQEQRFLRIFSALRAGTALPAHGSERVCQYCEMDGLCRKAWCAN